jgi:hypothetical protein
MDCFTTKLFGVLLQYYLICCKIYYSCVLCIIMFLHHFFLIIVLLLSWEAVYLEPLKIPVFKLVICELHTVCTVLFICVSL